MQRNLPRKRIATCDNHAMAVIILCATPKSSRLGVVVHCTISAVSLTGDRVDEQRFESCVLSSPMSFTDGPSSTRCHVLDTEPKLNVAFSELRKKSVRGLDMKSGAAVFVRLCSSRDWWCHPWMVLSLELMELRKSKKRNFSGSITRDRRFLGIVIASAWPAPGSEDTELGAFMEPEVSHGETTVYARVQA